MLKKRIIPCLDIKDGHVVKGINFEGLVNVGDPVEIAKRYEDQMADEVVFLDITATHENRDTVYDLIERASSVLSIPLTVGGGIRTIDDFRKILNSGADKVSINSPALANPELITELADRFGVQCIVVGIDSYFDAATGQYQVKQYTGDETRTRITKWTTPDWVVEVQKRGAGEIVLNMMNQDGVRQGYDLIQLKLIRDLCKVPLIASGGAGEMVHFRDAFQIADVDGALAASVFHKGIIPIPELKAYLRSEGVQIRD